MHTLEQLQKRAIEIIDAQNYLAEPLSLYEPIDYGMRQGGKRIRPLLCLIAAELCGGEREKAEPAAVAVEMLHNFTLLHDDIMDCSPLRRGKPTVFRKYDQNKAILSGDAMFACAFKYLLQCDKEVIPQLTETLTRGAIEVCEGQGFDMDFENRQTVSTDEYLQMIKLKTGVLLSTALQLGAITAKADEKTLNLLDTFGKYIGIAFQIKDDMLDCWSDLDTFGKVCGADIIDRKKTFLYITALENATQTQRQELLSLYGNTTLDKDEKIQKVRAIYEQLSVAQKAQKAVEEYNSKAFEALEQIEVAPQRKATLIEVAKKLINRNK